jgi:hypothetical protein
LNTGWNQIGNPYPFDISWRDVLDANPSLASKLTEPKSYNGSVVEKDEIEKFTGAYVSFTGSAPDNKLKIPVAKNPNINRRRSPAPPAPLNNPSWQVNLKVSNGIQENQLGGIGMDERAVDGVDEFDDFSFPRFMDYLEIKHPKEFHDLVFTCDIVKTTDNHVWDFTTETNQETAQLALSWDNSYFGRGPELWLMDRESGRVYNMRSINQVEFAFSRIHRWRIAFGNESFVSENTLPEVTLLVDVYPNPFQGETTIEFAVSKPSFVSVDVLDMTGRQVTSLFSGNLNRDRYRMFWDSSLQGGDQTTAGLYLVRLRSSDGVMFRRIIRH